MRRRIHRLHRRMGQEWHVVERVEMRGRGGHARVMCGQQFRLLRAFRQKKMLRRLNRLSQQGVLRASIGGLPFSRLPNRAQPIEAPLGRPIAGGDHSNCILQCEHFFDARHFFDGAGIDRLEPAAEDRALRDGRHKEVEAFDIDAVDGATVDFCGDIEARRCVP